jgi:serine/threonine protein kinase
MTSTLTIGPEQQRLEGRTVRDIVEHDPAQVNEVWCRKIFRQLLQSLELQYAMHMPHRAITPDTVVFHDNGEPLLLPSDLSRDAAQDEAADLAALARVVHFAITRELAPTGPLRGRSWKATAIP